MIVSSVYNLGYLFNIYKTGWENKISSSKFFRVIIHQNLWHSFVFSLFFKINSIFLTPTLHKLKLNDLGILLLYVHKSILFEFKTKILQSNQKIVNQFFIQNWFRVQFWFFESLFALHFMVRSNEKFVSMCKNRFIYAMEGETSFEIFPFDYPHFVRLPHLRISLISGITVY